MNLPFGVFWILLFLCRAELGVRGVFVCIAIWAGLLAGFAWSELPSYLFGIAQVALDTVLFLMYFGGDIRIGGGPRSGVGSS